MSWTWLRVTDVKLYSLQNTIRLLPQSHDLSKRLLATCGDPPLGAFCFRPLRKLRPLPLGRSEFSVASALRRSKCDSLSPSGPTLLLELLRSKT